MSVDETGRIVLQGRLEELTLIDVLQVLGLGRKTGFLRLKAGPGAEGVIVFRKGLIWQALGADHKPLGALLVQQHDITEEELHSALARHASNPELRVGDILVDQGVLTRETVEDCVKLQIARSIELFLSWSHAEFTFHVGPVSPRKSLSEFESDFELTEGIEARRVLLDAMGDNDSRESDEKLDDDEDSGAFVPLSRVTSKPGSSTP
ncbi:MAG: DUF4388 domain-containing protein [Thermoanaerobaculia bacterium]